MTSQVIYIIKCPLNTSYERSLESEWFFLSETDVRFKLPRLCIPYGFRCAVINGFIYVVTLDGDIDRLEA